jgi:sugar lactone lactonase YvrE
MAAVMDPELSILADGLDHPEGVAWSLHGHLVCGGEHGQIISVDPQTRVWHQVANTEGWPLGMAFDASDRLYVCDYGTHAVVRVELDSGHVDDITTGYYNGQVRSPNYPVFATDGTLYFSDSGDWSERDALIFARTPDGQVRVATDEARGFANGLAIEPTGEGL